MKNTIQAIGIFVALILAPALLDGCLQGPDELHYDNPHVECMRNIAAIQIRATLEGAALCESAGCVDSEVEQRALITAQYIEDLCPKN